MADVKFHSFDAYFHDFHPHSLYYGFNGTGKTTLAGKSGLRTLLLDCGDAGVLTLRKVPRKFLRIIRVKSALHYLDIMVKVIGMAEQIDILVIDTLTGLQSMAIQEVKGKRNFDGMNQRRWGQVSSRVIECISETRNFPGDVIYLAQEKRKGRPDETGIDISPSLQPATREFLSGCVDWVGRLYVEGGKRKMSFALTENIEAKDRGALFPKTVINPKYIPIRERIVEIING
jgi:hypothetical protein